MPSEKLRSIIGAVVLMMIGRYAGGGGEGGGIHEFFEPSRPDRRGETYSFDPTAKPRPVILDRIISDTAARASSCWGGKVQHSRSSTAIKETQDSPRHSARSQPCLPSCLAPSLPPRAWPSPRPSAARRSSVNCKVRCTTRPSHPTPPSFLYLVYRPRPSEVEHPLVAPLVAKLFEEDGDETKTVAGWNGA